MQSTRFDLLLVTVLALVAAGCGREKSEQPVLPARRADDTTFHRPAYPAGRSIDTVVAVQIGVRKAPVYVVASSLDSVSGRGGRFDLLQAFGFDTVARRYRLVLSDSVESAQEVRVADVTGDGYPDVVVPLRQGGNDPITAFGLNVYTVDQGGFRAVFRSRWMNPELDTLGGFTGDVISVSREVWPLFAPHVDAESYVDDVFAYRDGLYRSVARKIPQYFRDRAASQRKAFHRLRDTLVADSAGYDQQVVLFRTAALTVLNLTKANAASEARRFWNVQRAYLQAALRPEQYDELEAFVGQQLHF